MPLAVPAVMLVILMITKSALLLFRSSPAGKKLLMVRARGKPYWLFPGGKFRGGESAEEALAREAMEELQIRVEHVVELGTVTGYTPEGVPLRIHFFTGSADSEPRAASEVRELRWFTRSELEAQRNLLTPITRTEALDFLKERQVW